MTLSTVPQTKSPAVVLEGAGVSLGGKVVVSNVDLAVGRGEFLAVLGPNGAGKSTLMKAILGLVHLSSGSARVLERAPAQARPEIGYLPQRHGFDSATRIRGIDLVRLGLDGARWGLPIALTGEARARRRAERQRIDEVIALVGGRRVRPSRARRALRRRAAAAADRSGAGPPSSAADPR